MNGALLAGLAGGIGAYREERIKKQDKELELEDAMKRAKLAQELQLQLAEKKAQLAQKYPTYQHFVTNPRDNSVTGFTETGMAKKVKEGDEDLAAAYDYSKKATDEQQALQTDLMKSQIAANEGRALNSTNTGLLNEARRIDPGRFKKPDKEKKPPKPSANAIKLKAMEINPDAFKKDMAEDFDAELKASKELARTQALVEAEQALSGTADPDDPFSNPDFFN